MHESGIAERLLEIALARARDAGAPRISDVHVEIGDESGVAPEAVELYWPLVSRGTPADGARLHIAAPEDPFACRVVAIDVPGDSH